MERNAIFRKWKQLHVQSKRKALIEECLYYNIMVTGTRGELPKLKLHNGNGIYDTETRYNQIKALIVSCIPKTDFSYLYMLLSQEVRLIPTLKRMVRLRVDITNAQLKISRILKKIRTIPVTHPYTKERMRFELRILQKAAKP